MTQVTVTVPAKTVTVHNVSVDVPATTVTAQVPVPAQTITQDVVVTVPAYDIVVDVPDPAPPQPTPTLAVPYLASADQGSGRPSIPDLFDTYLKNGYSGWVNYQPPSKPTQVDGTMTTIASRHGKERIALQLTCKTHDDAGLAKVLAWLPDPWRDDFIYNYFQEPEDNLTTAAQQQAYRNTVSSAAAQIRTWNQANPGRKVSWPYLELAEYSLLLKYVNNDLSRDPAKFKPPDGDYAGVLWSCFEYGEKATEARIDAQFDRIQRAMTETFPGKKWGVMAGAYTLEPVPTTDASVYAYSAAQKQAQAQWLTWFFTKAVARGAVQVGWYNVKFAGTGGAAGEGRVEVIPETLAAFKALPR